VTRPERPPVRARSGRRPLPPLIFLAVLAIIAGTVWWNVFRDDAADNAAAAAACETAQQAAPSLDPKTISIRVLNATDQAGLAQRVAGEMQKRGFKVDEVANDTSERKVTGVGEVRHGPRGNQTAAYVRVYLPDGGDYVDTRATAQVDVVLGPEFVFPDSLAGPEAVAAALTSGASAQAACGSSAPTSSSAPAATSSATSPTAAGSAAP
jgi:LytR cell envelope-related transcriptional attenuator